VQKQVATTEKIVRYLETSAGAAWVRHPAAQGSPYRALAEKYLPKGGGSVFSFGLRGGEREVAPFINALWLFSYQANVGDSRSLVINPARTTHSELLPLEQAEAGIPPETVRLSVGLEDPRDLVADLEQAFAVARAAESSL
jgi:O-acetylhomoserine (thiol)-lyase